jgi:hypothetical protein
MKYARFSDDRRYVVCWNCRMPLCQRDERERPGGPARFADGRWQPSYHREWVLVWEDGWHRVEDHIERQPRVRERLASGLKPIRHDWGNEERFAFSKFLRTFPPARCDVCGELNRVDAKRLQVSDIGAKEPMVG